MSEIDLGIFQQLWNVDTFHIWIFIQFFQSLAGCYYSLKFSCIVFGSELWTFPLHFIRCFCVVLSLCIDAAYTVFESRWHCCYLYPGFKRSTYKVLLCFISNRQYVRVWKLLLRYLLFIWGFQENVRRQNGRNRKLSFLSLYIICINMWMIIQTTNTLTQI